MQKIELYDTVVVITTASGTYRIQCAGVRDGFNVMQQIANASQKMFCW